MKMCFTGWLFSPRFYRRPVLARRAGLARGAPQARPWCRVEISRPFDRVFAKGVLP